MGVFAPSMTFVARGSHLSVSPTTAIGVTLRTVTKRHGDRTVIVCVLSVVVRVFKVISWVCLTLVGNVGFHASDDFDQSGGTFGRRLGPAS